MARSEIAGCEGDSGVSPAGGGLVEGRTGIR